MVKVRIVRNVIVSNQANYTNNPPIAIERDGRTEMAFEVELVAPARVVYRRGNPLREEAQLWIECADVVICG